MMIRGILNRLLVKICDILAALHDIRGRLERIEDGVDAACMPADCADCIFRRAYQINADKKCKTPK